jgi:hypothetical protein
MFWQADSGGPYARELIRALPEVDPQVRLTAWVGRGAPPELETAAWARGVEWVRLPLRTSGSPVHVGYELGVLGLDARAAASMWSTGWPTPRPFSRLGSPRS